MTRLRNVATATLSTLCATFFAAGAQAGDLNSIGSLTQDQFKSLSKDLGAIVSYKGVTPATPLGLVGIDMGVELTSTKLEHKGIFTQAGGSSNSSVIVPKLHVHKGLPGGLDIGGFVSKVDDANISLLGLEARYALVDDGLTTPAVGLRVAGTRENGVSQIDLSTLSFDVMVSKKLTLITPFAGVGTVKVKSQPNVAGLAEEKFNSSRVFIGVNANFALMNIAVEAEKQGDNTSISAKAGFRF
jgi:hypothetical protein